MLESFIFSVLNGVLYGMLLFMLASGLTLIFGMMGVLNFAHASYYMLGAYFAFSISEYAGFWVALILAPIVVGLLGALTERFGLRNVHKHGHVAELLFTFGLVYVIDELVVLIWGRVPVNYQIPTHWILRCSRSTAASSRRIAASFCWWPLRCSSRFMCCWCVLVSA